MISAGGTFDPACTIPDSLGAVALAALIPSTPELFPYFGA
jgi:hypothetical protein